MTSLHFRVVLFFILILPVHTLAQDIPLDIKGDTLVVVKSLPFTISAPDGFDLYDWTFPSTVNAIGKDGMLVVQNAPRGSITVALRATKIDWEKKKLTKQFGNVTFSVGVDPPLPPVPPVPPVPPDPPTPIPVPGFRVLIVYESADLAKMPAAQQLILFSKAPRDLLNQKCVVGPDGKTKEWRIWDKDSDVTNEPKVWQDVFKRPRSQVPWVVISSGTTGYEGPLPANVADFTTLLGKYGAK